MSDVPNAPTRDISIDIKVLPCVITNVYPGSQFGLKSFEYSIETGPVYLEMDLFEQFPACNYTTNYGFAMAEQMNFVAPAYDVEYNDFYPGDYSPVTIDKEKKRVVIETKEMGYDKKSFAIFITATPEITEFQDPITGVAAPFTVGFVKN